MKHISRLAFIFTAVFGVFAGQLSGVVAQGGSGLQISPTKSELVIEAGQSDTFVVNVSNVTGGKLTAEPVVYDFTPKDDGTPQILTQENAEKTSASLKSFITDLKPLPLAPGDKATAQVTVKVPAGQAAGSYYGVILFNALPEGVEPGDTEGSGGKVSLSASVGHIVLVQVPGNITEKMGLVSVVAGLKDKDNKVVSGSMLSKVPNQVSVTVRNTGNSILRPFGNILIEKGGKNLANIQLNNTDVKATVLPNSNRIFTEEIKDLKGFGRFSITVNVSYGNGGDILTQKLNVWVIPVWLAGAIGAGVLAVAGLAFFMVRKFRG